ncbi:MAG: FtsX-like permease family protein [Vicinamibacteraceae bacterium]|nr:FtsX-like permease family protein [Vicinamibacteraceae bacterium]
MKYLPYILKHLRRNWIRTGSTIAAMAVCILLFCTLQTVVAAINYALDSASARRLWTRHAVSLVFELPLTYKDRIAAIPGVQRVAYSSWFNGIYIDQKNFFANFATDIEPFLDMNPEIIVRPEERAALMADRRGCMVGRLLAEKFNWKVGDTFQMESPIPPYRIGQPFEFVIRAIYDADLERNPGTDLSSMFFHHAYLYEATGRRVGTGMYVIEIADPDNAGEVSKAVDAMFADSDAPTKTETEAAFVAGFIAMAGNLALLINAIGLAVAFTILLVTANTMSMAVRERRREIAVLKTLGFTGGTVLALIIAEALVLGVIGGGLGLALGWASIQGLTQAPVLSGILAGYPKLGLTPMVATLGMGLALTLGLLAGLFPALAAYRARVTEMLREV